MGISPRAFESLSPRGREQRLTPFEGWVGEEPTVKEPSELERAAWTFDAYQAFSPIDVEENEDGYYFISHEARRILSERGASLRDVVTIEELDSAVLPNQDVLTAVYIPEMPNLVEGVYIGTEREIEVMRRTYGVEPKPLQGLTPECSEQPCVDESRRYGLMLPEFRKERIGAGKVPVPVGRTVLFSELPEETRYQVANTLDGSRKGDFVNDSVCLDGSCHRSVRGSFHNLD